MSAQPGMTSRRFERVPVRVPMYVSTQGILFRKRVNLECRDISGGGLAFETGKSVALESKSRIEVGLIEGFPPAARIEGRVVYKKQDPETRRFKIGVEFTRFINTSREELIEHIHGWPIANAT